MSSSASHHNISEYAQHHHELVQTYCNLSVQPTLNDRDAAQLDIILAAAEADPLISFLLDEADHMLAHLHGCIDANVIADQQEKLKARLSETSLNQAFQDLASRLKSSQCQHLQQYLHEQDFYQGAIDGVMGPLTKAAIKQCYAQHGQLPELLPIHTPDVVTGSGLA